MAHRRQPPAGYVRQLRGGASARPVTQVLKRVRFDADQRGEIHLALCEHEGTRARGRPPLYLHLYNETVGPVRGSPKPAALNAIQLAAFIEKLQALHAEMTSLRPRSSTNEFPGVHLVPTTTCGGP